MQERTRTWLVCVILVISTAMFIYGAYLRLFYANPHPLLDIATNFVKQENFITNIEPLRVYLYGLAQEIGDNKMTLYFEVLNTGANISINKDSKFWPASLAKLPLAMVAAKKVEDKEWTWKEKITVQPEDPDSRSGTLYTIPVGTSLTVETLVQALLIDSDNTAQRMLLREIGPGDVQKLINATGLDELADASGRISAKEYSRFFRVLYTSSFLEPADSEKILKYLSRAKFKDYLSQGIPEGVKFSHKYGELLEESVYSDSGIVYLENRPYMITLMLQGTTLPEAKNIMKQASEKIFTYMSEQ